MRRLSIIALVVILPATVRGANVVVTYLVEQASARQLDADTPLAFELHADAACSSPIHVATVPAADVSLIEKVRPVRVRGAGAAPRAARLHHVIAGAPDTTAYFLRVVGLVSIGGTCQPQVASQDRAGNVPCAAQTGNEVVFEGCNVTIRNGAGDTGTPNGLGNLVLGYNAGTGLDRSGSHNLVVGDEHAYPAAGGVVAGFGNTIAKASASVLGGLGNAATEAGSVVCGGVGNRASGVLASVSGGRQNVADGFAASVSGGQDNRATGGSASVSGGFSNSASGESSSVTGGAGNVASRHFASITGGANNLAEAAGATVGGGAANVADGDLASVSGGVQNVAGGIYGSIAGGQCNSTGHTEPPACVLAPAGAASVIGGYMNVASGTATAVSGGRGNTASGTYSAVAGGTGNLAAGTADSVGGGRENIAASFDSASVSGGQHRVVTDPLDWAAGTLLEDF